RAILATLGRVGQKEAVGPISDAVDDPAEAVAAEAATALASLVERRKVDAAELDQAVERLKTRLEQIPVENWQLRQPFVEAMARIGHEAFRDVFMSCLDKTNRPTIRQAAIRGLSKLGKAGVGKLLIEALGDSDAGVRQAAAEGLGRLGNAGAAEALFERLAPSIEPDPNVQAEAWKSFVRLYQASSAQEQLAWLKRIDAAADATWAQRFVELAKLAEGQLGSGGADFWAVQRDWGRALMTLQRYQEAAERLAAAYELASSSGDGQAGELAVMVVDAWLRAGEIDKASEYASRLLQGGSEKLREAILELLRGQVEAALKAGQAETSLALLKRVDELFGQDLEASWKETFARARARAERLGREKDAALLRQAIARLGGDEGDQARKQIMELGRRAVPQLAAELMRLVRSENHDVALEKALLEILTELAPEWQGYDLKLPVDQKCSRLQELARPED
ncbi:MAG: HEAT repeat domain-containing protein, partial [Phycisphaerae bacterium]